MHRAAYRVSVGFSRALYCHYPVPIFEASIARGTLSAAYTLFLELMHEITRRDAGLKDSSPGPILSNGDEVELARLGYKQELRRAYKPLEVFGLSFSVIGLLPSIAYFTLFPSASHSASYLI